MKMIPADNTSSPPAVNQAKKDRAKKLSRKAISNVFGSEDGVWDELAVQAKKGNIKAMEMLLTYQYGKAGDNKENNSNIRKAPVISFNITNEQAKTIDIEHEENE